MNLQGKGSVAVQMPHISPHLSNQSELNKIINRIHGNGLSDCVKTQTGVANFL